MPLSANADTKRHSVSSDTSSRTVDKMQVSASILPGMTSW